MSSVSVHKMRVFTVHVLYCGSIIQITSEGNHTSYKTNFVSANYTRMLSLFSLLFVIFEKIPNSLSKEYCIVLYFKANLLTRYYNNVAHKI